MAAKNPKTKAARKPTKKPAKQEAKAERNARGAAKKVRGQKVARRRASASLDGRFPVVGLGASAGGLGALEQFFAHLPVDNGMAFVVVTHQRAKQPSLLAELLGRKTDMPVVQVTKATRVEPNHVYTAPPGFDLAIIDRVLQPMEPRKSGQLHLPIDSFFRSLARDQKEWAVAIVLSGTGSDGSLGLEEVKGELGMVMAQEEHSAQYGGMPHSAIATNIVDYVLPPASMPDQLISYAETRARGGPTATTADLSQELLRRVFVVLRDRTGHDFSHYKASTIGRRIERRMNVHRVESLKHYLRFLQANPAEVDVLFKELLIGVTSFFRDSDAWRTLAISLCRVMADKPDDYILRAWVPGCSTGEEAYSLAILLKESMDAVKRSLSVQVFATDLDASATEVARQGAYPRGIASDVSAERLARFFVEAGDGYRVKKEIREMLVFAPQNLLADPPFTKLDILSCRNLLIYFDASLQQRLLPIFHYALRPEGLLFLGSSESVSGHLDLFSIVDKKWKLFRRREVAVGTYVAEFPPSTSIPSTPMVSASSTGKRSPSLEQVVQRMLLKDLVPPTVLVHERGDVVHVHGRTGLFLEPAEGQQTNANIFNMARPGLQLSLSSAIRRAVASGKEVVHRGVQVETNGDSMLIDLHVECLTQPESLRGLVRVSFDRARPVSYDGQQHAVDVTSPAGRLAELEHDLQYTKESHQSTIGELETANEELKSLNEELQSTNEELQSANEELGTSKEELQSLNEELQTVNAELQGKVDELSDANNDMKNLLNGTDIATIFLDDELRIKRFTEQAKKVIRLISTDVGRPIGDLVSTLQYDRLVSDTEEVLRTLVCKETEVCGQKGEWYLMRILPYRTTDNVIDGVVLTFVDVTKIKRLRLEQQRLLDALQRAPVSVSGQDRELRFTWVHGSLFGRPSEELIGKVESNVFRRSAAGRLSQMKQQVLAKGSPDRRRVDLTVGGKRRTYDVYVEPTKDASNRVVGVSCVVMDITPTN